MPSEMTLAEYIAQEREDSDLFLFLKYVNRPVYQRYIQVEGGEAQNENENNTGIDTAINVISGKGKTSQVKTTRL